MPKAVPFKPGERFGRLTAVAPVGSVGGRRMVSYRCDCGAMTVKTAVNVRAGITASCGCLQREKAKARLLTHGEGGADSKTAEYRTWLNMATRCHAPASARYADYGGRGIRVCDRWRRSYSDFLADMGRRPSSRHSIDRIDNNGNYEPSNCRWATPDEQRANRRDSHFVTWRGESKTVCEWAKHVDIAYDVLYMRLRNGWDVDRALTEPVKRCGKRSRTVQGREVALWRMSERGGNKTAAAGHWRWVTRS